MRKLLLWSSLLALYLLPAGAALAQTAAYIQWPLSRSAADSAAVRAANLTPGTPVFKHLAISSGQPVAVSSSNTTAYAPYTRAYGQAFGWNASGGGWSSSATPPGPGSTVRRGTYEEFSVTATAPVQADSLIFTMAVANSGNGFLALTYSKSGFTADSAEFTGGKGPNGTLGATANGTFTAVGGTPSNAAAANRIQLLQYDATTADNTRTYRMAFNGAAGLTLASGNKLTVRLHPAVSSSSDGRYLLLKNVIVKSKQAAALASRPAVATDLNFYPNPAQASLTVPHAAAGPGARVLLYSATGARVLTQAVAPGAQQTTLELASLPRGLYLLEYADGATRRTARLVKE